MTGPLSTEDIRDDRNEPGVQRTDDARRDDRHRGVVLTGEDGADGAKAFFIEIEALPGREADVAVMLRDILGCVEDEPATGPWFAVRFSRSTFGIFEAFPDIAGRDAHVAGGGGDIFRDIDRMNAILARPAHVHRVDVLMTKAIFAR